MLLLLGQNTVTAGTIKNAKWLHLPGYAPRCLCGAENGFAVVNPYAYPVSANECISVIMDGTVNCMCYYDNEVLAGTNTGIYSLDWSSYGHYADGGNPLDASDSLSLNYNTTNGLLSDQIISLDACNEYLVVVTSGGLSWKKSSGEFINYVTTSGHKAFVDSSPTTYLADGNTLRIKYGEPVSFDAWDTEIDLGESINDLWVSSNVIFMATDIGISIWNSGSLYNYTAVSGSLPLRRITGELDTTFDWGHIFVASSDCINIFNLKQKAIESHIDFNDSAVLCIDYPRIYSR